PLRLVTCIWAGLCGGVRTNAASVEVEVDDSTRATLRSRSTVSRGCMAGLPAWTSNTCFPRAGPDSEDSGGRRASRTPCGDLPHDALPRGSRHYAPEHVRPDVPAGLRTCGRGSCDPPTCARFPATEGQCMWVLSFPLYRCGAVPDLHRIPFQARPMSHRVGHRRAQHIGCLGIGQPKQLCVSDRWCWALARLECVVVQFAGTDADDLIQRADEDLAVADLAGARGRLDRFEHAVELVVGHGHLQLDLGQEVDHVLGTAIELGMALLATETLHLGHGDALHADFGECLAHIVQFERLDDRHDQFHEASLDSAGIGTTPPRNSILPVRRDIVA